MPNGKPCTYFNKRGKRRTSVSGHLFQGRYKSEVVENDKYLLTVLRYIHQNPLKAKLTKDIRKYKWSSYSEYINKGKIIDGNFILDLFSRDRNKAIVLFDEFHKIETDIQCLDIDETRRLKDSDAVKVIKDICNIFRCIDLQKFHIDEKDKYLSIIKEKGLSTRQIARMTGISRGIILRV